MEENARRAYTKSVKDAALAAGADLAATCLVKDLQELPVMPEDLLEGYESALVMAVALPRGVFETIGDRPTHEYARVYQSANRRLDDLAFTMARLMESHGFTSLPVPASQIKDTENWRAAISHKAVARVAGLGWQGKSLLLVTRKYGPRVRLVTVLTAAPLVPDKPEKNRCGDCTECADACPAGAIRGVSTKDRYESRNHALHFDRCVKRVTAQEGDLRLICGVCVRACPWGKKTA
ncbi:MAG: 4Fe-4S double cluster binding domain-containing protein [Desulfatibacillaceae bacterium]